MLNKALLLKPGDPDSLLALGAIYSAREMHDQAIETFYQALKNTSDTRLVAETYNSIGRSYYSKKMFKKALQAFTRGIEEDPSNEQLRINRKAAMQAYETELAKDK